MIRCSRGFSALAGSSFGGSRERHQGLFSFNFFFSENLAIILALPLHCLGLGIPFLPEILDPSLCSVSYYPLTNFDPDCSCCVQPQSVNNVTSAVAMDTSGLCRRSTSEEFQHLNHHDPFYPINCQSFMPA